eukprot:UN09401
MIIYGNGYYFPKYENMNVQNYCMEQRLHLNFMLQWI